MEERRTFLPSANLEYGVFPDPFSCSSHLSPPLPTPHPGNCRIETNSRNVMHYSLLWQYFVLHRYVCIIHYNLEMHVYYNMCVLHIF